MLAAVQPLVQPCDLRILHRRHVGAELSKVQILGEVHQYLTHSKSAGVVWHHHSRKVHAVVTRILDGHRRMHLVIDLNEACGGLCSNVSAALCHCHHVHAHIHTHVSTLCLSHWAGSRLVEIPGGKPRSHTIQFRLLLKIHVRAKVNKAVKIVQVLDNGACQLLDKDAAHVGGAHVVWEHAPHKIHVRVARVFEVHHALVHPHVCCLPQLDGSRATRSATAHLRPGVLIRNVANRATLSILADLSQFTDWLCIGTLLAADGRIDRA
mmetsp:Transcript_66556/g.145086  ORF Transcript_66556/g.145086 Transcript_66556/m.145086 type:complete len:266 (-) Transcript_66556:365-1162(-)